jgi:hypothetical protein
MSKTKFITGPQVQGKDFAAGKLLVNRVTSDGLVECVNNKGELVGPYHEELLEPYSQSGPIIPVPSFKKK